MAPEKKNGLSSKLHLQKSAQDESSILQEEDKKWSWTQVFIFILVVYAAMSFMNGCFSIIDLKAQQNAIVAQTQDAEAEQSKLENEVSYMQTQEAVEKTAREDLNMVKPGEILLAQRESTDSSDGEDAQNSEAAGQSQTRENDAAE